MQAPCKDCPDRHYLCHSTCEKYREFRKHRDFILEQKRKEQQLIDDLWASSRHNNRRKHRRPYPHKGDL